MHDPVPGNLLMRHREDATDEPGRVGIDVAVSLYVARRDVADPREDRRDS